MALNAFDEPLLDFSFVPLTVFQLPTELLAMIVHDEILSTLNPAHIVLLCSGVLLAGLVVSPFFTHLFI
jgi:hypothetical protein